MIDINPFHAFIAAIQAVPVYMSFKLLWMARSIPRWRIAWGLFTASMVSILVRRVVLACTTKDLDPAFTLVFECVLTTISTVIWIVFAYLLLDVFKVYSLDGGHDYTHGKGHGYGKHYSHYGRRKDDPKGE